MGREEIVFCYGGGTARTPRREAGRGKFWGRVGIRLDRRRRIAWEWRAPIDLAGSHADRDPWVVNGSEWQTTIWQLRFGLVLLVVHGCMRPHSGNLSTRAYSFFLFFEGRVHVLTVCRATTLPLDLNWNHRLTVIS